MTNPHVPSKAELTAALNATFAIAEAIREAGSIPSGHLYAVVCGKLSLAAYEGIIRTIKNADLVSETANMLRWIGPEVRS